MRDGVLPDSSHLKFNLLQGASSAAFSAFAILARDADSLRLTTEQRSEIAQVRSRLETVQDSAYGALAGFLAQPRADYGTADVRERWHSAIERSLQTRFEGLAQLWTMLDATQIAWLKAHHLDGLLETPQFWIDRLLRRPNVPG
jgi:hypothetical protein